MLKRNFITDLKQQKGILILGHRGCRKSDVCENTLPAFRKAFDAGADGIEIDVETASDGRLVVINRWFANQTLGFFPWEKDLDAIQAAGMEKGVEVPGFEAVCELIKGIPEAVFNIEIKSSDRGLCRTAKQVSAMISNFGIRHRVIVSSFDMNTLLTMKIHSPGTETAYLFRRVDRVRDLKEKGSLAYRVNGIINRSGMKAFLCGADTLHPEIKLIDVKRIPVWQRYAELGSKRINCWTVDTESDLRKAVRLGAHAVISDHPEQMVAYRSRLKIHTS